MIQIYVLVALATPFIKKRHHEKSISESWKRIKMLEPKHQWKKRAFGYFFRGLFLS